MTSTDRPGRDVVRRPAALSDLTDADVRSGLVARAVRELARTQLPYGTPYERQNVDSVARTVLDLVFNEYREHRCTPPHDELVAWLDEKIEESARRKDYAASRELYAEAGRHHAYTDALRSVRRHIEAGVNDGTA